MRRRSLPRARRVTAVPPVPRHVLPAPIANLWNLGLQTVRRLQRFYPTFYAEHVATRPLTESSVVNTCEAFLSLVDRDLPLLDMMGLHLYADPLTPLLANEPRTIETLQDYVDALYHPLPTAYGVGLQEFMDEGEPDPSLLTVALWWLGNRTEWGLGLDFGEAFEEGLLLEEHVTHVTSLKPLPSDTDMVQLCTDLPADLFKITGWSGQCVAYAFARTGLYLADWTDTEIEFQQYNTLTWDEFPVLRVEAVEAKRLAGVYGAWETVVRRSPSRVLPLLARVLHTAAAIQRLAAREARSKTLIDILAPTLTEASDDYHTAPADAAQALA